MTSGEHDPNQYPRYAPPHGGQPPFGQQPQHDPGRTQQMPPPPYNSNSAEWQRGPTPPPAPPGAGPYGPNPGGWLAADETQPLYLRPPTQAGTPPYSPDSAEWQPDGAPEPVYEGEEYAAPPRYTREPYGQPPGAWNPVNLWPRLCARLIDSAIAGIPGAILTYFFSDMGIALSQLGNMLSFAITFGYFVLMEMNGGATLGKKILRMRVLAPGGAPTLGASAAIKRNSYLAVSIIPWLGPLIGFVLVVYIAVTLGKDPNKQGWHDKFAGGTLVVRD